MFFDRPAKGSRALLVQVNLRSQSGPRFHELKELTLSAQLESVAELTATRTQPDPRYFIGSGKLNEVSHLIGELGIQLTIFNHDLSPTQERNLEARLDCRVMSRTELILEIFSQRARTHEGKLQVELAQLQHTSGRLVRGWTHLDRQRGGSGRGQGSAAGLGGAGEKQIETDQRLLGQRIKKVHRRLEKVHRQRAQNRRTRARADIRTVALVGYTNAGKSTLFNQLCQSEVYAADELFATLDPTIRKLFIPLIGSIVLADTVGFISQLPHTLIEAFKATLEEVQQADLLLHIVDSQDPDRLQNIEQVNRVLTEIDANKVPQLLVYNKIDLGDDCERLDSTAKGVPERVWMSALKAVGIDLLVSSMGRLLVGELIETTLRLEPTQGRIRAQLFELGGVLEEKVNETGQCELRVRLEADKLHRILGSTGMQSLRSLDSTESGSLLNDGQIRP